jgi:hypothetical protein
MGFSPSPWLFAGNRVLLRLTVARHPPYALGYLLLYHCFLDAPVLLHTHLYNNDQQSKHTIERFRFLARTTRQYFDIVNASIAVFIHYSLYSLV